MSRAERMRLLSRVLKEQKEIDAVELYQFFSDFALDEAEHKEEQEAEPSGTEETFLTRESAAISPEEIRQKAEAEAHKILADARRQGEILREEAYEKGREAGYEAGYQKAREEYQEQYDAELLAFRKNISEVMESVTIEKSKVMEKYQDSLRKTVVAIAEKVIHTSLKSSGDVIHRMVLAATDKLKKTQWAKIYITKCNTDISMEVDADFLNSLARLSDNIKIISMDNEEEGICIVELPDEIIDASVSTQLENIKGILNNARI